MSNEFVISSQFQHVPSGLTRTSSRKTRDQTGTGAASGQVILSTSETTLNLASLTTPGQGVFINLEALGSTDLIELGIDVGGTFRPLAILYPQVLTPLYLAAAVKSTTPLEARATANTPLLDWTVYEA